MGTSSLGRGHADHANHRTGGNADLVFEDHFIPFAFEDRGLHFSDQIAQGTLARDGDHAGLGANLQIEQVDAQHIARFCPLDVKRSGSRVYVIPIQRIHQVGRQLDLAFEAVVSVQKHLFALLDLGNGFEVRAKRKEYLVAGNGRCHAYLQLFNKLPHSHREILCELCI